MAKGAPYIEFAILFRQFLKTHAYETPMELHRDLQANMRDLAPSVSTVYAAVYGHRVLPLETILFMQERYGFGIGWRQVLPVKNLDGAYVKSPQLTLPTMREMKR